MKNILSKLFILLVLLSPALMAVELVGEPNASIDTNKNAVRHLHGNLVSLNARQVNTSLGSYDLTDLVKVVDERKQGTSNAKVQLTIRNNILIKVVIYE